MSFTAFLKKVVADKVAVRDDALERAETRDNAAKMAADINIARTAHNKARGLSRLNGETMNAAAFSVQSAIADWNTHKSRKVRDLAESLTTGRLKGAECIALIPILVRCAQGEGYMSRALLEASQGAYTDNYRTFWKPLENQGVLRQDKPGKSIVGYHINIQSPLMQRILEVFG